jgi:hypothetical protein
VTEPATTASVLTRRTLLRAGGVVSLGALVAACGGGDESTDAPGRVGYSPAVTPLPTAEVNDAVLLRTAASLEYTAIESLQRVLDAGMVGDEYTATLERFLDNHMANADHINELVEEAGGEPFTCPNPWLDDRAIGPMFAAIAGDEDGAIPPSDDPERDALNVIEAIENLNSASFQAFSTELSTPELRRDAVEIAATEARQAALLAYTVTGAPQGYVNPALTATEPPAEDTGHPTLYALNSRMGSLTGTTLRVGAADEQSGSAPAFTLETPAENAYVYDYVSC